MRKLMGLAAAVATSEPADLDALIGRANKLDISTNNPALGIGRGASRAHQGSGGRDPNAMDVDATTTRRTNSREEFLRRMRGRCFGCGQSSHAKRDCTRARNVTCNYCRRKGHLEQVCQDKFMGLEKGRGLGGGNRQHVAATNLDDEDFSLFADQPRQAGPSMSNISAAQTVARPGPSDALTAQIAQLTNLLSGFNNLVNSNPQGF